MRGGGLPVVCITRAEISTSTAEQYEAKRYHGTHRSHVVYYCSRFVSDFSTPATSSSGTYSINLSTLHPKKRHNLSILSVVVLYPLTDDIRERVLLLTPVATDNSSRFVRLPSRKALSDSISFSLKRINYTSFPYPMTVVTVAYLLTTKIKYCPP